jgi:hypothetical protein
MRACAELLEPVCDFPFARAEHRSAYLSGILTPLARYAFCGPAPWHIADANVRAIGKGLLIDVMGEVAAGREFARATYTHDNDEMRKVITAPALAGEPMVLLDNLAGTVGGANLDAALTATEWQGRRLGTSEQPRVPFRVTFYGTGNNTVFRADTARRVLQIRLGSKHERPEERSDFKQPNLLAYVRQERSRLLVAALTTLAAYCRAGRPAPSGLKPWGSFEGWTGLVRGALVWAGQPDPGLARMSLVEGGDRDAAALQGLLAGWLELDPHRRGLTVKQALDLLQPEKGETKAPDNYPTMRAVLAEVFDLQPGQLPKSQQLGYRLRAFAGRNCEGQAFVGESGHGGVTRWRVLGTGSGGDAGDGGDVPANLSAMSERSTPEKPSGDTAETSPPSPPSPPAMAGAGVRQDPALEGGDGHGDAWEGGE